MQLRNTIILIVVAAALGGYFFLVEQPRQRDARRRAALEVDLADFSIAEATDVTVKRPDATLEFVRARDGQAWLMKRPVSDRAEDGAVNRLLGVIAEGEIERDLGPQRDLAPFGLTEPAAAITVLTARGDTVVALDVGDFTVEKYHAYARRRGTGADAGVLLVPAGLRRYSLGEPFTFRSDKLTEFELSNVRRFIVSVADSVMAWQRDSDGQWTTVVAGSDVRGRKRHIDEMVRRLRALRVAEFVPAAETTAVRPFDAPPRYIAVTLDGGDEQRVRIGRRLETRVYAGSRLVDDAGERVVLTDTTVLDLFAQSVSDLRDRRLLKFDRAQLGRLELESAEVTITLVKPGKEWGYPNPAAGSPDPQLVGRAIDAISDLEFGRVLDEAADGKSYGLSNAEIRLTLYDESGERIDRLLCTRSELAPGGYVVTSDYSGVAAVIDGDDLDAAVDAFRNLRQP
jgi:hypothetical protein